MKHHSEALAIYVIMARDWSDALEMIQECSDRKVLDTLLAMLKDDRRSDTNRELNALFVEPVERRIAAL